MADPYLKAFASSLCCDKCGAVNGCDCYDEHLRRIAPMLVNLEDLRLAEVMARHELRFIVDGTADRLRQHADAWVSALRRGDYDYLTCEAPRIPSEVLAGYLAPVIEHFERELEEAREEAKGRR